MRRAIAALWMAAIITLVTAGMEFYDAEVLSGATMLLVAAGFGGLAGLLTRRYG